MALNWEKKQLNWEKKWIHVSQGVLVWWSRASQVGCPNLSGTKSRRFSADVRLHQGYASSVILFVMFMNRFSRRNIVPDGERELSLRAKLLFTIQFMFKSLGIMHIIDKSVLFAGCLGSKQNSTSPQSRTAVPSLWKKPAEVAQVSNQDASWMPPCGGVPDTSNWEVPPLSMF